LIKVVYVALKFRPERQPHFNTTPGESAMRIVLNAAHFSSRTAIRLTALLAITVALFVVVFSATSASAALAPCSVGWQSASADPDSVGWQ
jgi:hypothetical protein